MLGHVFELVLGPRGDVVNIAVLVAHKVQLIGWHGDGFGADAEKTADLDDNLAAVQMRNLADLLVVRTVYGRPSRTSGVNSLLASRTWLVWSMFPFPSG